MNTHRHRPNQAHRTVTAALAAALVVLTATGCQPARAGSGTTAVNASTAREARRMLDSLTVRAQDTGAHYLRSDWGTWAAGADHCDTRARVLVRDAIPGTLRHGTGCRISGGAWISSYDGVRIIDPHLVQIDHRVPVHEAAQSETRSWSSTERHRFYNDPDNLVAVSARSNTSKGDGDPGQWRPPNRSSWCAYATGYIATKRRYALTIDPAERAALVAMLNGCPGGAR